MTDLRNPGEPAGSAREARSAELLSAASERIRAIGEAAAHASSEIAVDALRYADAGGGSAEREQLVSELARTLVERADAIRKQSEQLTALLDRAAGALAEDGETAPPAPPVSESSGRVQPERRISEGVRLLTTQMAVAGSSRTEIAERLRREFGVSDAHEVVARVLGEGGS